MPIWARIAGHAVPRQAQNVFLQSERGDLGSLLSLEHDIDFRSFKMKGPAPIQMNVKSLTTCQVAPDGSAVYLSFEDAGGQSVALQMPRASVQQLVLTLPSLLSKALRAQHGDSSLRAVFPLSEWRLESAAGSKDLILTMRTPDGFEVAFVLGARNVADLMFAIDEQRSVAAKGRSTDLE
jgi:hypothetical protein